MLKQIYKQIAIQTAFLLVLLSLARVMYILIYPELFGAFSFNELAFSVIHGIRFDIVVVCKLFGLIFLVQVLFINTYFRTRLKTILDTLTTALLVLMILSLSVDTVFFDLRKKHLGFELFMLEHDVEGVFSEVFTEYRLNVILTLAAMVVITRFWRKTYPHRRNDPLRGKKRIQSLVVAFLFFLVLVIGFRGGIQKSPVIEKLAFTNENLLLGHLTLNVPYTLIRAFEQKRVEKVQLIDEDTAVQTVRKMVFRDNETPLSEEYPLMRVNRPEHVLPQKQYNVIFIILESWSSLYVGALSDTYKDNTPYFDKLARESLLFPNFWGNGLFSNDGFAAIMASVPTFPHLSLLDSSYFGTKTQSIPKILIKEGYDSLFIMGYPEGSSYIDYFMKTTGVKRILLRDDFPEDRTYRDLWGIWDEKLYDAFLEETAELQQPFFSVLFTSTTHTPHTIPDESWVKYGADRQYYKFRNSLAYADWALGRYIEEVRRQPYFENTLFVLVGDHTTNVSGGLLFEKGRIPMLLYTPDGAIKAGVNQINGSQVDIMPTLLDLLGLKTKHASAGRSLFSKEKGDDFALHNRGGVFHWIQGDYLAIFYEDSLKSCYNLEHDRQTQNNLVGKTSLEAITRDFRSYYQLTQNLVFDNRVFQE